MTRSAWYLGCRDDEVGEAAILVGDRGRIDRIADHLERPHIIDENRGLRTVTGFRDGRRVTVSAFGMGGHCGDRAARAVRSRRAQHSARRHGDADAARQAR